MIPVWQGSANTWDCDEMGHMNVRVYVDKALEGLGVFAAHIGMPHAFRENAPSTLILADQHIRYIREVHPGRPLKMTACVLEVGEHDAVIYQDMRHADGRCAAAFRTRVIHADAKSGAPFRWSARSREALTALIDTPPDDTKPRSIDPAAPVLSSGEATLDAVQKTGAPRIGIGSVPLAHCDAFGRMQAAWFMGRLSDSVPNLLFDWRNTVADKHGAASTGGAVLEYRLVYRRWPRAGDLFEVYSSYGGAAEKTHSLVHWVMDPISGEAWLTCQAVAVTFDLQTRKIIPTPKEQMAELEILAPKGLSV